MFSEKDVVIVVVGRTSDKGCTQRDSPLFPQTCTFRIYMSYSQLDDNLNLKSTKLMISQVFFFYYAFTAITKRRKKNCLESLNIFNHNPDPFIDFRQCRAKKKQKRFARMIIIYTTVLYGQGRFFFSDRVEGFEKKKKKITSNIKLRP